MGNRSYALITGLFVIILGGLIAVTGYWLSDTGVQRVPYIVVAYGNLSGLNESSPVFYRGVAAGHVESIRFNPEDMREILITILVNKEIPVTRGTYASLRPQGITGLSQLELADSGEDPELLAGSQTSPPRIPMQPGFFDKITSSGESVLANIDRLAVNLNDLLESNREQIDAVIANVAIATARADRLVERLEQSLRSVPQVGADLQGLIAKISRLVDEFSTFLPRLQEIMDHTGKMAAAGKEVGEQVSDSTLPRLNHTLDELAATGRQLQLLIRKIQNHPQSLLLGPAYVAPGPGEPGYKE